MMIDMHTHIAWGIDDGLQTKVETIQALQHAKTQKIIGICLTPHVTPGITTQEEFQMILYRQKEVMELAKPLGIYVYSGCEMMMNIDFLDALDQEMFQTLNESKYLLIEFSYRTPLEALPYIDEYIQEIICRGMVPVIAHVERYFPSGLDTKRLEHWLDLGCLFQVNRSSILGLHGKTLEKNAWDLLERKWVHLVSSDAHRLEGSRVLQLDDVYKVLEKKIGLANTKLLLEQNPYSILMNTETKDME